MAKKVFLLLNFFLLILTAEVLSQEPLFDFSQAYEKYLDCFNHYRQAHQEYITKKQAFLSYQTQTAQNEAEEKTKIVLQRRDEVIEAYLTALRLKMAAVTNVANYQQNVLYLNLDKEINWYLEHQEQIGVGKNLVALTSQAKETENQYSQSEVLAYQALAAIMEAKQDHLLDQLEEQSKALEEKLFTIKEQEDKNIQNEENWLTNAQAKISQALAKQAQAKQALAKIEAKKSNKASLFGRVEVLYQEAFAEINTAYVFLQEIIKEIKQTD